MGMMKFRQIVFVAAVFARCADAAEKKRIYRDSPGRFTGSATTRGGQTTYRDALGQVTGTKTVTKTSTGSIAVYRDVPGRTGKTATTIGRTTTYRDARGRTTGTKR